MHPEGKRSGKREAARAEGTLRSLLSAAAFAAGLLLSGCLLVETAGGGIETGNPENMKPDGGGIETGNPDNLVDGGGIETGNTGSIAGRVLVESGAPAREVQVSIAELMLSPDSVVAPRVYNVLTDSEGGFSVPKAAHGRFAVYAIGRGETRTTALQTRVRHASGESRLPDLRLAGTVRLQGRVLPAPGHSLEEVIVCIPGAHVCAEPSADSVYTFEDAPQGAYEVVFLAGPWVHYLSMEVAATGFGTVHVRDVALGDSVPGPRVPYAFYDAERLHRSVSVMPVEYPAGLEPAWYAGKDFSQVRYLLLNDGRLGEVTTVDYFGQWRFRRELAGPALSSLGNLPAGLPGFPVPVRLSAADFDFASARPDGGDLVVSDGKGRLLPHEIERWDASLGKAEIWVRLDTLAAAQAERRLVLHWGRDESFPVAGGAGVFRAEDGFTAVWHLGDRTPDTRVLDSRGRFHGRATESKRADWKDSVRTGEAVVAGGHRLGSSGAYVHVNHHPGLDVTTAFTLSLWGKSWHSDPDHDQVLATKMGAGKHEWRFRILDDGTLDLEFGMMGGWAQGCVNSNQPVPRPDQWHLYSATFDNGQVKLFVDGKEVPSRIKYGSIPKSVTRQGAEIRIGSDGDLLVNWEGTLDEFSYYNKAKSPAWIEALYRTQQKP